jgi:hypothetical protein
VTTLYRPHVCDLPLVAPAGTVWQCEHEGCGQLWRAGQSTWWRLGFLGRWWLRKRGRLP